MALQIGQQLGVFQISSLIGKGGIGEVYRAKDTKLTRSVAIKFLPEAFSHDTGRVARFQREAPVLASLNMGLEVPAKTDILRIAFDPKGALNLK